MEININQRKVSAGDKYNIFTNEKQTHFVTAVLFKFLSVIDLFDTDNKRRRMTINKRFFFVRAKYDITGWDNTTFKFRTKSFWKNHYRCAVGKNLYDVYGHKGRKYSVYKNGVQIGWWSKQAVTWFKGDNYKIIADDDADHELLICFCLIIDNFINQDHNSKMPVGNFSPQAKKFDKAWQPKIYSMQ